MNVYFIPGMSANCKVFDRLVLPDGFDKKYIEWHIPRQDETLEEYTREMAEKMDTSQPFVLIGYSFGAIVMQEMNKFLSPVKKIVIASMKDESEIPPIFRFGRRIKFAEIFPLWSITNSQRIKDMLTALVYNLHDIHDNEYIERTEPEYTQWTVKQILNWTPTITCPNLYHIHGTRDRIFPQKYIKNAFFVDGGDHLMVMKLHKKVSLLLQQILNS